MSAPFTEKVGYLPNFIKTRGRLVQNIFFPMKIIVLFLY